MRVWKCFLSVFLLLLAPLSVLAQDQSFPGTNYDWGIGLLRDGKTADAVKEFSSGLRGGFKIATERWLDSICYAAMLGEAQYQLGQYPAALESFETAIRLSIQYSNWLTQVQNVPNPGAFTLKPVPWGDPNPGRRLLNTPSKFSILFGDLNYGATYRTGGVAMAPSLKSIRGTEIVRCTLLALRRRAELLGPLGSGDELNGQFVTKTTQTQRALAGSWFQAWLDIELGLGYLTAGKADEAAMALQRGALINGSAHPLTPIAYLELGKIQLKKSNYEKAYNFFLEAATIAFYYEDVEIMTEAFEFLENAYCQRNLQMLCPPLLKAAEWAKFKKLALLFATLQTAATDDFLRLRQLKPAMECLALAEKAVGKSDQFVLQGRLGAVINYQKARIAFQNPTPASQTAGYAALGAAMQFMQFGAVWNFQILRVDAMLLNGQMTSRKALEFYQLLLREPTAVDWALNPVESMAVTVTPRPGTWENFFLCAIDMEKKEEALEISERARRATFLQTLDLGGRIHSLRLLLEGPEKDLTVKQAQRKRDILTEYPAYEKCSEKVRELQIQIRKMSLPVTQKEDQKELAEALRQIAELSRTQEAILTSMVLDRRVIEILFPKVRTFKEIQESLPKGEAMLVTYAARNQLFVFLMNNEQMRMWKICDSGSGSGSTRKNKTSGNALTSLQTNFSTMLRDFGLGSGTIPAKTFTESNWKKSAQRVIADLEKNSPANFASADFSSLVIVPDRFMWYVPFEALQIQTSKGSRPTISQFSIRYAPMASLATPWKKIQYPKSPYSLIVAGKNAPGEKTVGRLEKTLERPVLFEEKSFGGLLPGQPGVCSSVFAPEFDKMFVFEDLKNDEGAAYTIFPMALDRTAKEGSLGYWFLLPSGSPRLVFLSGMRTRCEGLAKKASRKSTSKVPQTVPGQELFLTSMAFLANGADSVILPRWRLEGTAPWKLAALMNAQLPNSETTAEAWRRAVLKFSVDEIAIESEPRIGKSDEISQVSAAHPFFWAGYMLVDSGSGSLRSKERLAESEDENDPDAEAEEEEEKEVEAPQEAPRQEKAAEEEEVAGENGPEIAPPPRDGENPPRRQRNKGRLAPPPPMGGNPPPMGGNPPPMGGNPPPMGGNPPAPLE